MANPQCEDGYTKISNELLEAFCRHRINGEAMQIIFALMRKTYGYKKKIDRISNSQLVTITGLRKGNISRELSRLITNKIVIQSDNKIGINKNYDEWQSATRAVLSKVITSVIQSDNKKLSKVRDTKEKKETITKEITTNVVSDKSPDKRNPELQVLIDHSDSVGFVLQGTLKDNRFSAYNLLRKFGLDKSIRAVDYAVKSRGRPYAPNVNDFMSLYRKIGDLINFYEKERNERKSARKVVGGE